MTVAQVLIWTGCNILLLSSLIGELNNAILPLFESLDFIFFKKLAFNKW